jgi:hypothetical protein
MTEVLATPGDLYVRSLNAETDLYLISSGEDAKDGYVGIPLKYIEVVPGTKIDVDNLDMSPFRQYDPQPPRLLTYLELADRLASWEANVVIEKQRRTEEFEALTGTHQIPA